MRVWEYGSMGMWEYGNVSILRIRKIVIFLTVMLDKSSYTQLATKDKGIN